MTATATATVSRPRRRSGARDLPGPVWAVLSAVLAVGGYQLTIILGVLPAAYFPSVGEIGSTLVSMASGADLWRAAADTMISALVGLAVASVLAIVAGAVIGSNDLAYRSVRAVVEFLRPIPSVALVPLVVLAYGTGREAALFLVAFACFWPMLVQTVYGIRDLDRTALETARSFRTGRLRTFTRVVIPSASPYILTGLRIAFSISLVLAITAELVIGMPGLGRQITVAQESGDLPTMYALIIVTGMLGYVCNGAVAAAERRLLSWHASQRGER
ncbi:ABC transporter permease [Spiractinospora alimapuensis]|uniref:ABC transporter permease n=1 Tax=Spiractinospora alimapuensis TaxID=2820884 RepID=UPI001F207E53|nr:ABC transporter permease [Spiractinospora alimapuensis]QVQ54502.1 ABC transporter permease [Spiractinospora alimapuensis]